MASMLLKTSLSKTLICLSHKFHIGAGPLFVADAHVGLMGGLPSIDAGLHEVHANPRFLLRGGFFANLAARRFDGVDRPVCVGLLQSSLDGKSSGTGNGGWSAAHKWLRYIGRAPI